MLKKTYYEKKERLFLTLLKTEKECIEADKKLNEARDSPLIQSDYNLVCDNAMEKECVYSNAERLYREHTAIGFKKIVEQAKKEYEAANKDCKKKKEKWFLLHKEYVKKIKCKYYAAKKKPTYANLAKSTNW